jgi:phospholipid/cholesterol/gamma-HCH transport system substrate-binding protein
VNYRRLSLLVGGFVALSLALLVASILLLSSERGIFTERYRVVARFDNVQGLLGGAPVWLAGKEVGRVETVRFDRLGVTPPIIVVLKIDADVRDRVRADSIATIGTIGLLGDSYVEISLGSLEAPEIEPGGIIRTESPVNLNAVMTAGTVALDEFAVLAENLNRVVEDFAGADGSKKTADAVAAASEIAVAIQEGPGLLHSLVYDQYEGGGIESIERSLAYLEDILDEIRDGQGIFHSLIFQDQEDQDLVAELVSAAARLNSVLEKIDDGDGSLGLLVNDPTVYDDLKLLLNGAQRSLVLRSLISLAGSGDAQED